MNIPHQLLAKNVKIFKCSSDVNLTFEPCDPKTIGTYMSQWQDFCNKRAMMALDGSPESFSPQMNSTSLFLWFQLVTPGVGPVLIPRGIK